MVTWAMLLHSVKDVPQYSEPNGRGKSWEHCYFHFITARDKHDKDFDYLSLHLSFYLASWGMYRGSSFLIQRDYRIHIPAVVELLSSKYDQLAGIDCKNLLKPEVQNLLDNLISYLKEYYAGVRQEVNGRYSEINVSETLITKIIMGTLGCVPSYDKYFKKGLCCTIGSSVSFTWTSLLLLVAFYAENNDTFEKEREKMKIDGQLSYPQMKLLDMLFWKIGWDSEQKHQKL